MLEISYAGTCACVHDCMCECALAAKLKRVIGGVARNMRAAGDFYALLECIQACTACSKQIERTEVLNKKAALITSGLALLCASCHSSFILPFSFLKQVGSLRPLFCEFGTFISLFCVFDPDLSKVTFLL